MFGYHVPAPDEAMLISGGKSRRGRPVPGRHRARRLRLAVLPQGPRSSPCRCSRPRSPSPASPSRASRCTCRRSSPPRSATTTRVDRQRRAALPVRPEPDGGAHRPHLRRPPALDHRLDDGRGDHHRAAEARHRGARRVQGGDGEDRADRRRPADPVDRRHEARLHRRDGRAAQRRDPAAGPDRPGAADQAAAEAEQQSLRKQAEYERRHRRDGRRLHAPRRRRRSRRRRRPARSPRPRRSARSSTRRPTWRSGRPSCASSSWSPRSSSRPRRRPSGSGILARADAERTEIQAAAAASNNRVALDQLLIEQLPQIVEKAAAGSPTANVTVLNGADGLSRDRRPDWSARAWRSSTPSAATSAPRSPTTARSAAGCRRARTVSRPRGVSWRSPAASNASAVAGPAQRTDAAAVGEGGPVSTPERVPATR